MTAQPITIYLDQLHWIHLAQARTGHKDGHLYDNIYQHLLEQKRAGKIICPLSLTHYMELSATGSYRQRNDVAQVMAELSGFKTISSTTVLRRVEVARALHKYFGRPTMAPNPVPFGFGVFFAARGENKMMKFKGDDTTIAAFAKMLGGKDKIKELEYQYTAQAELELLRGPRESQIQELRNKYDYDPEAIEAVGAKRAAQEEELAQQLMLTPARKITWTIL